MEDRGSQDNSPDVEAALEPELPICDAHHHLWERPPKDYLLDDFLLDLRSGHKIVSTVAIECGYGYRKDGAKALQPVGETEFLDGVARRVEVDSKINSRIAAAIVGHADLSLGDGVAPVLEAHLATCAKFRGIRHSATWDASDAVRSDAARGLLADGNFRRGFAWLERLKLSFDVWVYHPQLAEVATLAQAFPGVTIILNHIGAPLGVGPYADRRSEVFANWRVGIEWLARCPNVCIKLGGVGSLRSGFDWHERPARPSSVELAEVLRPYFEVCIGAFGAQRCMFESNFPVERSSNSYGNLWNAFKRITEKYADAERSWLFHDTAARVYRLANT